jgi:hypothetical protein
MMIKNLTMSATLATIGIGIAVPSNASTRVLHNPQERANTAHSYRPPAGQIYVRGFRDAPTPAQKMCQDFQLDGVFQ